MTAAASVTSPPDGYELVETPWGAPMFQRIEATCEIKWGLTGYYMNVDGACFEAAVATVLQRPLESIPPMTDEMGLLIFADDEDIDFLWSERPQWGSLSIGFTAQRRLPTGEAEAYGVESAGHTVVLEGDQLVFNPASRFLWLNGAPTSTLAGTPKDPIVKSLTLKERLIR